MDIVDQPLVKSLPLKIGLIETPPYIYKNSMGDIDGFEYDIIKHIVDTNQYINNDPPTIKPIPIKFLISKSLCNMNIPNTNATSVFKFIIDLA